MSISLEEKKECAREAAELRVALARLKKERPFNKTVSGDKYTWVKGLNDETYHFSRRIGEALVLLKKAKGNMLWTKGDVVAAVNSGIRDCAQEWGIKYSTVMDKITRQFGIVGDDSVEKAKELFFEALKSEDSRFDDLLIYLICAATRKDDIDDIRDCYMNL